MSPSAEHEDRAAARPPASTDGTLRMLGVYTVPGTQADSGMHGNTHSAADEDIHGRPLVSLVYLVFLYLPLLYWRAWPSASIWLSLLATVVFVPLFLGFFRAGPRLRTGLVLVVAAMGFALIPFNPGANTFLIYAMAMAATTFSPRATVAWSLALLLAVAVEFALVMPNLRYAFAGVLVVAVIGGMVVAGSLYSQARAARNAELKLTQDEVKRLARLAERERIGRDLHDLLGHTLSLVALKSELAGKLIERDPQGARLQISEVEHVARQALAQVREAVSGMRASGLEAELAAARLALLSAGVAFDQQVVPLTLAPASETALTLGLREAVTNVLRHAGAQRVEVELAIDAEAAELRIADDGCGDAIHAGNGLCGMRERLEALGGSLGIDSEAGAGTRLRLRVPLAAAKAQVTA